MAKLTISNTDFKLFKEFKAIPRIIIGCILAIGGLLIQFLLPISGRFPFEETKPLFSFLIGLVLLVIALLLLFPERLLVSEEPPLVEEKPFWKDYSMKQLSAYFNLLNNREKKKKSIAAIFDLKKPKGKWVFFATIVGITTLYLLVLFFIGRLFASTALFLVDIYLLLVPLWFIIRIEHWDADILRKILFYYQFTQQDELDDLEFITTPAVQLQRVNNPDSTEEIMLPLNVRFMIDFTDEPDNFDSLACQILINQSMGNKFPSFVCFLRIRKHKGWQPLKKTIAYSDRIVKIEHLKEEDRLHLFVLSKSPKVDNKDHTSPREASIIFNRAHKMMRDFAE